MASIIKADGETESVDIVKGNAQLDQLQTLVGGYIEHLRLSDGDDMWMNEDGLRLGLAPNMLASLIAEQSIVGDVVVTNLGEVE